MLYTCSYKNFKSDLYKGISISWDHGKDANFNKSYFDSLAPLKTFFRTWKDNRGIISEDENNLYYIREYYREILSKLDPEKIYKELDNSFLLCYEKSDEFCHRHIVAAWFELFLNISINEVDVNGLKIDIKERPEWIKKMLESVIKENTNMRGFNSLRALYLFNQGEKFEKEANEIESVNIDKCNRLRQAACYMRCEADMAEEEYNNKRVKKLDKSTS